MAHCSIYVIEFWRVERFFKLSASLPYKMVDGTPYKSMVLKLLGVRVGKRLFDNGAVLVLAGLFFLVTGQ